MSLAPTCLNSSGLACTLHCMHGLPCALAPGVSLSSSTYHTRRRLHRIKACSSSSFKHPNLKRGRRAERGSTSAHHLLHLRRDRLLCPSLKREHMHLHPLCNRGNISAANRLCDYQMTKCVQEQNIGLAIVMIERHTISVMPCLSINGWRARNP